MALHYSNLYEKNKSLNKFIIKTENKLGGGRKKAIIFYFLQKTFKSVFCDKGSYCNQGGGHMLF